MAELKTFLFTDICRSVDLKDEMIGRSVTERDMAFIQTILTPHRERIEGKLAEHGGRVVSTAGDGHFLVFDNTILAAQWAVDVQQSHRDDPILTPDGKAVEVRISAHVGVPQVDPSAPDNFVGKSVDYAARLNDYATGGQILVSRSVMAILDDIGLDGISFHQHGRRNLKGIGRVEVHELMYEAGEPRPLRRQPSTHTNRQWTVVPTVGFDGSGEPGSGGGSDAAAATATQTLKRVGNYELEEVLGAGGMGDVYKARHTQFNRIRAVKVIKPQYVAAGNQEVIRRFYQEIKAIGALEHKNIVVAIDSSAPSDRVHYLVMEYIDGVALNDVVGELGPMSVPDACEAVRQAARGLQYIHRHGMVHRDIKPSNLMLTTVDGDAVVSDSSFTRQPSTDRGVVKILDLGLALLAVDKQDRLTRFDNKAMGTGMYMSPEQWKTTSVDIRSDIYSLGCTLYHLLAGNPPFVDSDLRPEKAHEKSRLPPIRSGVHVPRKLWDVLNRMMAKRPDDRYATPDEVAATLVPFCEGHDLLRVLRDFTGGTVTTLADRPTTPEGAARADTWRSRTGSTQFDRRRLLGWALPGLGVAGTAGAAAWYWWQQTSIVEPLPIARLEYLAEEAATRIGKQLGSRFKILESAAKDPLLRAEVEKQNTEPSDDHICEALNVWLTELAAKNVGKITASSWFVNDRQGYQIARYPKSETSLGGNYAIRDYFHGKGRNLDRVEAESAKPISKSYLSSVYASSSESIYKLALSVPILANAEGEDDSDREVLGIIAMSVELGEVVSLPDFPEAAEYVLIDMRSDAQLPKRVVKSERAERQAVEEGGSLEGLILHHHPHESPNELKKISSKLLARIAPAMALHEAVESQPEPQPLSEGYNDPSIAPGQVPYWGAVREVTYKKPGQAIGEVSTAEWAILVQSPMPADARDI